MKKKFFFTAALSCCFLLCLAAFADLNGKWTGSLKTPDGNDIAVSYTFKVDGEKLTGTSTSPYGDAPVEDGKIKGDNFTFKVNVAGTNYPHTGKVYADSCVMSVDFGGSASNVTLKHAK